MLKFVPILKRNGAHLVEKKMFENKKIIHSQGLSVNIFYLCQALSM